MDLLLTIVVLGGLAAWTARRGQLWVPVLCLLVLGMSLVSPQIRGVVHSVGNSVVDGGSAVLGSVVGGGGPR